MSRTVSTTRAAMSELDGRVLLIRLSGVVTASALWAIADEAASAHAERCRGFIIDYRPAVLAASADQLGAVVQECGFPAMRLPGAYVVAGGSAQVLMAHAVRMAHAGLWRRTFSEVEPARAWVVEAARR